MIDSARTTGSAIDIPARPPLHRNSAGGGGERDQQDAQEGLAIRADGRREAPLMRAGAGGGKPRALDPDHERDVAAHLRRAASGAAAGGRGVMIGDFARSPPPSRTGPRRGKPRRPTSTVSASRS
jgi:hypothetical protein